MPLYSVIFECHSFVNRCPKQPLHVVVAKQEDLQAADLQPSDY